MGLLAEKAEIVYDPNLTDPTTLSFHMHSLGFGADLLEHEAPNEQKLNLIVSHTVYLHISLDALADWRDVVFIVCAFD